MQQMSPSGPLTTLGVEDRDKARTQCSIIEETSSSRQGSSTVFLFAGSPRSNRQTPVTCSNLDSSNT
ncbi:hypothetical protein E2C01_087774 [Portunus trituberculatus]|uniref:Uncharacterized protein n=1 Tax=Portunus trituberculatus TaxID=210409 RepID=A0A5B7J4E2_PORTR|nr:hypothetical protein [Portunus trituberculatus]